MTVRAAAKVCVRLDLPEAVPWSQRLFGLLSGVPLACLGTLGLIHGRLSLGWLVIALVAAFGWFIVLGAPFHAGVP